MFGRKVKCDCKDKIERKATARAKVLFDAWQVDTKEGQTHLKLVKQVKYLTGKVHAYERANETRNGGMY